jgi:hypothetical protein
MISISFGLYQIQKCISSHLNYIYETTAPSGTDISSFFRVLKNGGFLLPCYAEPLLNLTITELTR